MEDILYHKNLTLRTFVIQRKQIFENFLWYKKTDTINFEDFLYYKR